MSDDELRELAHNHGNTERLFICEEDGHCKACKLWGDFSVRLAARAIEDYQDEHAYDSWGEDA